MKAIAVLRSEHDLILSALDRLEAALNPLELDEVARLLEFVETFVDVLHQQKEEEVLFPLVVGQLKEMVRGAIDAMTKEHFMARAYVRAAKRAFPDAAKGDAVARALLENSLESYVVLMRAHVKKENEVLFPFIERTMDDATDATAVAQMASVEAETIGEAEVDRLEQLVRASAPPAPVPAKFASFIDARTLSDEAEVPGIVDETVLEAKAGGTLFDEGGHQNIWLHDFGRGLAVQANQFLIVDGGEGMVLDPGGPKVYPDVYAETMLRLRGGRLRYVFLSHQDPDIGTSLNAWLMDTDAEAYVSRLWVRFLPHFGIDRLLEGRLLPIPDEGMTLKLGRSELVIVPAHFLHSPGNFQVYDPTSKVLFSGDVGASIGSHDSVVKDFTVHAAAMRGFHQRYIATGAALRAWARAVRRLDIETVAPQHGAIFEGKEMVNRFFDWCEDLPCGLDVWPELFHSS